jgi:hypothetical protein
MLPSVGLALLALLRRIRSIGHTLKSFILRCLLFRPRFLRSLRRIWSPCSERTGTGPKDVPKNKADEARPSFPGASGVCEGYSTIYASWDFNRTGEPHLPLGPGNAEALPLGPTIGRPQSASRSPTTSSLASSLPGSPRRSDRQLSGSRTPSITSSHNADSVHSRTRQLTIRHLNTPLTLTHSRVTSTRFAGAPPSRPPSPSPAIFPTPILFPRSRSPSPSPSPRPHPLPLSTILDSSVSTRISDVAQDTSEGSHPSSFDIRVSPPSRSQTLEFQSTLNSPQSSLSFQQGHSSGQSQSPTSQSERPMQDPLDLGGFRSPYMARNAHHSSGSLPAVVTPTSNQARYQPSFPQPYISQVSINVPVANASETLSDGRTTRSIKLMHSEQVSRYVNKGDM